MRMKIKLNFKKIMKGTGYFMSVVESLKAEGQYRKLQSYNPNLVKKYENISLDELVRRARAEANTHMLQYSFKWK